MMIFMATFSTGFTSCSSDEEENFNGGGGNFGNSITLTMEIEDRKEFGLDISGTDINIDWGDGNSKYYTSSHGSYFTKIEHTYSEEGKYTITITGNSLTKFGSDACLSLDVSKAKGVTYLEFGGAIESIDLSKNTELLELDCSSSNLSNLDLSKNNKLTCLSCDWSNLSSLDLSKNTSLQSLSCSNNKLEELILNSNDIKDIGCVNNKLSVTALNNLFNSLPTEPDKDNNVTRAIVFDRNPGTNDCDRTILTNKGWIIY